MLSTKTSLISMLVVLLMLISLGIGIYISWNNFDIPSTPDDSNDEPANSEERPVNVIVTGNTNLTISYLDSNNELKPVGKDTDLFNGDSRWTPGRKEVVYLTITNNGATDVNYSLGINVVDETGSVNIAGEEFKLSDHIRFGFAEDATTAGEGDIIESLTSTETVKSGVSKVGVLTAEDNTVTLALVVYLPESSAEAISVAAGNYLPKISLGLSLLATQPMGGSSVVTPVKPEGFTASTTVTESVTDGVVSAPVVIGGGQSMSATLPEGVKLEEGATDVTLSVNNVENSEANITLGEGETQVSLDVHITGIAADNTVPMTITLSGVAANGLNSNNIRLYHVENGETIEMTALAMSEPFTAHNQFKYDPITGTITLYMASFSEVAVVAEPAKWNGTRDYTWYNANATELYIANAQQLAGFSAIVGGMDGQTQDSFKGKTVKLAADINIGDLDSENSYVFYPIGYWNDEGTYEKSNKAISSGFYTFQGTFDGTGHTISNFYQNTWEMKGDHNWYDATLQYYRDGMGLFGKVYGGTVKNLTIDSFSSDGEITTTGVIAAYADCGATFENIAIFNCNPRVYNIGNGGIVGCVGWYANDAHDTPVTFKNITVDNSNKISALWGSYDVACGGIVGQYYPTSGQSNAIDNGGIYMENCHVAAVMDVYNDVCANYQYYAYRYAGILIGSVRENITQNGRVYPNMDGIEFSGCTVHFGDWNDYYYCEIVANTTASYTHDHQMSRLTQVEAINGTTITYLDGTTGTVPEKGWAHYVVVLAKNEDGTWKHGDGAEYATCHHFKDGAVWTHDMAGYHDGQNGEKYIDENGDNVADLKEDKQLIYREFNNLVTGYGWGVTSKAVTNYPVDQVKILDRDEGNSVKKFQYIAGNQHQANTSVNVGELFKYLENCGVSINSSAVQVSATPVNQESSANAVYVANSSDWTQGTLRFGGVGELNITITDYHYCTSTTFTVMVYDNFQNITATTKDNYYNVGYNFTTTDFRVSALGTSGFHTPIGDGYTVDTNAVDVNTPGTYTVKVTYVNTSDGSNETFTTECIVRIANLTERDDYSVTLLGKPLHIYIGADRLDEYPAEGTHTTANSETISGLDSSNYQNFDFTVDNATRSTRLAFNAPFVTNNAAVRGFGYYIDGKVGSLVATDSFVDGNNGGFGSGYTYGGHVDTSHMIPMYCNNFASGTTHTVHWVVIFDEGIKTVGTWTVNMKEGVENDEAFIDTDKPNANVIILAGQSNAFGITPLTQAVKNQYADVDFSNIFINYNNVYYADGTGANADLKSYYSNIGFVKYEIGMGVYDDGSRSCFGPELGIAATLANDHPGEQWYIIKYTMPSSCLATNWMGNGFTVNGENTNMMNDMLDFIENAVVNLETSCDVNIRGFAWMQGESDSTTGEWANAYAANEQLLVETVRTRFAAYATRTANAADIPGSGIAFLNAGIASYDYVNGEVVASQWTYENGINTAKVNNSEFIFSAFKGYGATDLLGSGVTFPQAAHLNDYTIGSNLWIQKDSCFIENSFFIDTVAFHTKATITKDHTDPAYNDEDRADHAHYAPDYMTYLGQWFVNCMDLLHQQNG